MYCVRCGRKLPGEYNKCRKCRADARENAWYCPECGNGVKKTAKECDVCKTKLDLSPANYVVPEAGKKRNRKLTIALALVLGFSGLHLKYLGFDKRFIKRIAWAAISAVFSVACLLAFQIGIESAFVNGYDAVALEAMTGYIITLGICICAGALSFIIAWGAGIAEGIGIIIRKDYQDADGQVLE